MYGGRIGDRVDKSRPAADSLEAIPL